MNPHNSPWNKPKPVFVSDPKLWRRWFAIKRHLTTTPSVIERNWYLEINGICYVAKNSSKMRLISHIDWCHYTPKTFAQAIDSNSIEAYYERQLNDPRSDPNIWSDTDKEMEIKTHYAERAGRASKI